MKQIIIDYDEYLKLEENSTTLKKLKDTIQLQTFPDPMSNKPEIKVIKTKELEDLLIKIKGRENEHLLCD